MADPATIALFVAAAAAVGGGVIAYQGAQYERDVAEENAVAAAREGTVMAQIESQKAREAVGRGRALAAASGLAVDGSASMVLGSLAAMGDYNARQSIYNGRRRVQQANADAKGAKMRGNAALVSSAGQAASILTSYKAPSGSGASGSAPATAPASSGPKGPW